MGAGGHPTKYRPEYDQMLIEHMAKGYSFESFAAVINVHRETLYEWAKVNPKFSEAKNKAFDQNLLFWEAKGIDGLHDDVQYNSAGKMMRKQSLNATVWIFNMKNRHKWRDRQEIELETKSNLKDEMKKNMSLDQLMEMAKEETKDE